MAITTPTRLALLLVSALAVASLLLDPGLAAQILVRAALLVGGIAALRRIDL